MWFPRIDAIVAKLLEECIAYKSAYDTKQRESIIMYDLPSRKWFQLCPICYGPLHPCDYLLVIMDEYSRIPEIEVIRPVSVRSAIPVLDNILSSRCIPDNGTPFQSEAFRRFAFNQGIRHQRVTTHWPDACSVAERITKTIGKVCKCAQVECKPWKLKMYRFLRNYRATPHTSTGQPPATILNGVPLKIKLPEMRVGCGNG